jgi:hypothetical protein
MKVLAYEALVRDFRRTWAAIESTGEEVVVKRDRRRVARIVPEPRALAALDVFGDVHGALGEAGGAALTRRLASVRSGKRRRGTLRELRNPWAS